MTKPAETKRVRALGAKRRLRASIQRATGSFAAPLSSAGEIQRILSPLVYPPSEPAKRSFATERENVPRGRPPSAARIVPNRTRTAVPVRTIRRKPPVARARLPPERISASVKGLS